jgi:hypothetical protein
MEKRAKLNEHKSGGTKMAKRKKSKTAKAIKSAKSAVRKTGAGLKRVAKKAARATGLADRFRSSGSGHVPLN